MNHKLIVVFDGFTDEDHARWYGQYLKGTDEYVRDIYVVKAESECP